MQIKKRCLNCETIFYAKSEKHIYCCRKCFKQAYTARKREEEKNSFPTYCCPTCGYVSVVPFHPAKKHSQWLQYSCPRCGISVAENVRNNPD